jgi:hypothetical protein
VTYVEPTNPTGNPGESLTIRVKPNGLIEAFYSYTSPAGLTYDHPVSLNPAAGTDPALKAIALFLAARAVVWA